MPYLGPSDDGESKDRKPKRPVTVAETTRLFTDTDSSGIERRLAAIERDISLLFVRIATLESVDLSPLTPDDIKQIIEQINVRLDAVNQESEAWE